MIVETVKTTNRNLALLECMRNYTVLNFIRFTIIIVYGLRRMFLCACADLPKIQISVSWNKHTAFESHCSSATSYLLPFSLH